jgi:hypothetical protein
MDLGTFLLMLALAYAFGLLWYDLLPGRLPERVWQGAVYSFLGIFVAEALASKTTALDFDPRFGGLRLLTAAAGTHVAVLVEWLITQARRPSRVTQPEPLGA